MLSRSHLCLCISYSPQVFFDTGLAPDRIALQNRSRVAGPCSIGGADYSHVPSAFRVRTGMWPNLVTVFDGALDRAVYDDVESLPTFLRVIGRPYLECIIADAFHAVKIGPLPQLIDRHSSHLNKR